MKVVWLAHFSVHLEVRLVKAPYRGINKLPAEPVVMIIYITKINRSYFTIIIIYNCIRGVSNK